MNMVTRSGKIIRFFRKADVKYLAEQNFKEMWNHTIHDLLGDEPKGGDSDVTVQKEPWMPGIQ